MLKFLLFCPGEQSKLYFCLYLYLCLFLCLYLCLNLYFNLCLCLYLFVVTWAIGGSLAPNICAIAWKASRFRCNLITFKLNHPKPYAMSIISKLAGVSCARIIILSQDFHFVDPNLYSSAPILISFLPIYTA